CANNLKQLGLALHSYESTFGRFPAGISTDRADEDLENGAGTGFDLLLPYIEQDNLQKLWNPSLSWYVGPNFDSAKTQVRLFFCPSSRTEGNLDLQAWSTFFLGKPLPDAASTDYLLCKGSNSYLCPFAQIPRSARGVFDVNSKTSIRDIADGTTNTFAIGEGA